MLYNTVLFFGWYFLPLWLCHRVCQSNSLPAIRFLFFNGTIRSYVLVRLAQFFLDGHHVGTTQGVPLWSYLRDPLLLFQSAALLEVSTAPTSLTCQASS